MSGLVLERSDHRIMLWHMAVYGLAAICEPADDGLTIRWSGAGVSQPRGRVESSTLSDEAVAALVRAHAEARASCSWLQEDIELKGTLRGLMSPRLTPFMADAAVRERVLTRRHDVLDAETEMGRWLDLRMLAALGEPAYWSRGDKEEFLPDNGASRLEMQPRNQGSEFVGSRLRKLAESVAARSVEDVLAGLTGARVRDEIGKDAVTSRTGTGFCNPGPVDNAVAWCALWGISQLPTAPRLGRRMVAGTSGHLGRGRTEWFYLPYWEDAWRPARLRTILAADRLRVAAAAGLAGTWAPDDGVLLAARAWLRARGVHGVLRFPIVRFGSDSAPERRAMQATLVPVGF